MRRRRRPAATTARVTARRTAGVRSRSGVTPIVTVRKGLGASVWAGQWVGQRARRPSGSGSLAARTVEELAGRQGVAAAG